MTLACSNVYCGTGAVAHVPGGLCDECLAIVWPTTAPAAGHSRSQIEHADRADFALARDRGVRVAGAVVDRDELPDRGDL